MNYEATENERKLAALLQLGSHYWTPDFTPAQAKHLLADYLEDLALFGVREVEIACRSWRQDTKNKRFPRAAELIQRIRDYRAPKSDNKKPAFGGRPILWWMQPKEIWPLHWRETEVPMGEMVKDVRGGKPRLLREAE